MNRKLILVLLLASMIGLMWTASAQAQVYVRFPGASSGWGGPYEYVYYGPRERYYSPWYPTYTSYYYPVYYPSEILTTPWYRMNYGAYNYTYSPYYVYSYGW